MKDFLLTKDGDLAAERDIALVTDTAELAQSVYNILSIRAGEFALDKESGLDRENMIGKGFNEEYLKQDISLAILEQEPRVNRIVSISIERRERHLLIAIQMISQSDQEVEVAIDVG